MFTVHDSLARLGRSDDPERSESPLLHTILTAIMLGASSTSDLISCSVVRCCQICRVNIVNVSLLFVDL